MFNSDLEKFLFEYKRIEKIKKPKDYLCFDAEYCQFLCLYKKIEIIPDIILFDYEKAIIKNKYIEKEYKNISNYLWIFADSGSGDEWFLHKENRNVFFYDHNLGEYSSLDNFVNMKVGFLNFINLAFLIRNYYNDIDNNIIEEDEKYFMENIYSKNKYFFDIYPYKLF
ncbi:MAG: hypothetical protein Q4B95_10115 [Lonepinella koalarum]|nr:hypothetical protein [Lonepinella koalarum]